MVEWHSTNWDTPVDIDFDRNGTMYVTEKEGSVWIVNDDLKLTEPLLDIHDEVANFGDHGMLSLALDRDFLTNGFFYVYYVVDRHHWLYSHTSNYDPNKNEYWNATFARVVRYQADEATGFETILPGSRHILIGESQLNGIPSLYTSHIGGSLEIGDDGTLLISTGDGSTWKSPYGGNGPPYHEEYVEQALREGIITPDEELGAYRAQYIDNYNGKILRIDPRTGLGLPSNPFYDESSPNSPRSKIYALGFRNGYRMKMRKGSGSSDPIDALPGVLYVADVGNAEWEELNIVKVPGQNFGWPIYEGYWPMQDFYAMGTRHPQNLPCENSGMPFKDILQQPLFEFPFNEFTNPCDPDESLPKDYQQIHTLPALSLGHWNKGGFFTYSVDSEGEPFSIVLEDPRSGMYGKGKDEVGICAIVGGFYEGETFPEEYHGKLFIGDYDRGWIKVLETDLNDNLLGISDFFSDTIEINHIELNPHDGSLYFIDFRRGIRKISYGQNVKPVAQISFDKNYGKTPLTVHFDAAKSYDPNGDPITYEWSFGNGESSDKINPQVTYDIGFRGEVRTIPVFLTVTDEKGLTSTDSVIVSTNNSPPEVKIEGIPEDYRYASGGISFLELSADVNDVEHDEDELSYDWQLFLGHNTHEHPETSSDERIASFQLLPTTCGEELFYWRVELKVTDPGGLYTTESRTILPDCDDRFVELLVFQSEQTNQSVNLNWVTGYEQNLASITIERSIRGGDYKEVGSISGRNRADKREEYSFKDDETAEGSRSYRLRFESETGKIAYSHEVQVDFLLPNTILVFPNPVLHFLNVRFGRIYGRASIHLFNVNGQRVLSRYFDESSVLQHRIDVREMSGGNYFYQISN